MPIRVHCFSGSPYTWRALIVLEEKGIEHESNYIPRMSGDHKKPEMLAANPRGRLPILEDGDLRVYESLAICDYLERQYPEPSLYPTDKAGRALAAIRIAETSYLLGPFDGALTYLWTKKPEEREREEYDRLVGKLHEEIARWEGYLAAPDAHGRGGGDYLAGDAFSMADVAFFPQLAFCVRVGFVLADRYPALQAYYDRVAPRPSIQAGWPPHWRENAGADMGFADWDARHPVG